jgi:hypothetical protein
LTEKARLQYKKRRLTIMNAIRKVLPSTKILLFLGILVLACSVASADIILSENCNYVVGPTEFGVATSGVLTCPGFVPGTGGIPASAILTSIGLTIEGGIPAASVGPPVVPESTITLTNGNSAPQAVDAYTTVNFTLPNAAIELPGFSFATHPPYSNIFQAIGDTGTQTIAGNSSKTFVVTGSGSESSTDTSTFLPYQVPQFTLTVDTVTAIASSGGGGQITVSQLTEADATAVVTYTYSPVPEPTTLVLLGSALLGLGLFSSKRRAAR